MPWTSAKYINAPKVQRSMQPPLTCGYCGKLNHQESEFWRKGRKCIHCGSIEHQISDCPKIQDERNPVRRPGRPSQRKLEGEANKPKIPTSVYAIDKKDMPKASNVVEGMLPVFHRLARILIDPRSTHSLVRPNFMHDIGVDIEKLPYKLEVNTPMGDHVVVTDLFYKNCDVQVSGRKLPVDLISLPIQGYDVILGMDWLSKYAQLDCRTRVIKFCLPGEPILEFDTQKMMGTTALISGTHARKLLWKEAKEFLAYLINKPKDKIKIDEIPVVNDYLDVFLEELTSYPRKRG
ncbi:hypothetical protein ACH5RR_023251 [Cinchona calisaya]|uniref:CCHC-type domain-containing protein n=1 Tax=Cinchona calisaya TaxID=153742 RepID=A0ABD2ZB81_9GENT